MKNKHLILVVFSIICISFVSVSCDTTKVGNSSNPQLNNNSFTNYTPWWVSNTTTSITNK